MTSERFPYIEVRDCLRQLWYVPPVFRILEPGGSTTVIDAWKQLSDVNPYWQLRNRRRYSLNTFDSQGLQTRNAIAPWRPPIPDSEFNKELVRPELYDNLNDWATLLLINDQIRVGVVVEFIGAAQGKVIYEPIGGTNVSSAVFNVYLLVGNTDYASTQLLRYLNWFQSRLKSPSRFIGADVGTLISPKLSNMVLKYDITEPSPATFTGTDESIRRTTAIAFIVQMDLTRLTAGSSIRSNVDIFDPINLSDPDDPNNVLKP